MKSQLQNNDIKIFAGHNEGNLVTTDKFIITLMIKLYKYLTSLKKIYVDELNDTVNEKTTILLIAESKWNLLI